MFSLIPQVHAQCQTGGPEPVNLMDCLLLSDGTPAKDVYTTPAMMVNLFVNLMFVAGGILFFVWILLAGWKLIYGKKKGLDEAKTLLTNAIIGLILMVVAYWVVQLIGFLTGMDIAITLPGS